MFQECEEIDCCLEFDINFFDVFNYFLELYVMLDGVFFLSDNVVYDGFDR